MIQQLPTLNACLNGISALFLCSGYLAIRRGRRELHMKLMIGALAASVLFLISYLTYHFSTQVITRYGGEGWDRTVYLAILASHSLLAVVNVPLVIVTALRAAKGRFDQHRRIARWTFPVWLYVSVTGVAIYLMLYVF